MPYGTADVYLIDGVRTPQGSTEEPWPRSDQTASPPWC
jgi:hypothetical protein